MLCTSENKMKLQENLQENVKGNDNDYFLLVNFSVLQDIFEEVSRCPDCDEWLTLSDNLSNRVGMAHDFELNCNICSYKKNFSSSKQCQRIKKTKGHQTFEVNVCATISFREVGCGYRSLEQSSHCVNVFCLAENAYTNLNSNKICKAYDSAAKETTMFIIF